MLLSGRKSDALKLRLISVGLSQPRLCISKETLIWLIRIYLYIHTMILTFIISGRRLSQVAAVILRGDDYG